MLAVMIVNFLPIFFCFYTFLQKNRYYDNLRGKTFIKA